MRKNCFYTSYQWFSQNSKPSHYALQPAGKWRRACRSNQPS
jgi:hypothetical protein